MAWLSRRRLGFLLGLALTLVSLLAVLGFAPQDPTLTNLRWPKDGISNWLGYPGALAGGTLVEAFGWAALLLPGAALTWTLCAAGRPRLWQYALQTAALLVLAASWSGQWAQEPGLGLAGPGLVGWSGGQWTRGMLGPWSGGAVLSLGLGLSLWHQFYAPQWRAALRDVRTLGRLFTREGWRQAAAGLRGGAGRAQAIGGGAIGLVLLAPLHGAGLALRALVRGLQRWVLAPVGRIVERVQAGAASLRRIKARAATAARAHRPPPAAGAEGAESGKAFDAWLEPDVFPADGSPLLGSATPAQAAHSAEPAAAQAEPAAAQAEPAATQHDGLTGLDRLARASRFARDPQAGRPAGQAELPAAGSGKERWEQLLRRYRENLDLDWDERSWRAKGEGEWNADEERTPPRRHK